VIKIFQVDAFTGEKFRGNPAAVCLLEEEAPESWMASMAAEMNLSETAFVRPLSAKTFELRWFTPAVEVELCGHATLAAAHVLWQEEVVAEQEPIRFQTRSGTLGAGRSGGWIQLDFPGDLPQETEPVKELLIAVGADAVYCGAARFDVLIRVASEQELRSLTPDFNRLKLLQPRGVIVTAAAASAQYDFVSRFFAPAVGIDEDPVTGSAHCALAPYWSGELGKTALTAYQASARGGVLRLKVAGERVLISGEAVTVLRGELYP